MKCTRVWTWALVVGLVLPGPAAPLPTATIQAQMTAAPVQESTVPAERMAGATAAQSAIHNPQSTIQGTGVYTEAFTTYAAKHYTDGAEWDIWAHQLRLARTDGMDQENPVVAMGPTDENAIVVWRDSRNGNGDIYAQKVDANGNKLWTADVRVNSESGMADQSNPAVGVEPASGNAIVVWEDYRNDNWDIYAQRLDASGNKLWAADVRVNSDSGTAYQQYPIVAVEPTSGNTIVVWTDGRNDNWDIYAQRVDASGDRLWAADARVNSDSGTASQYDPVVAVEPSSGNALVVWTDWRNGNDDIYAQRVSASGNKLWAADVRVNSDSGTAGQYDPAVAVEPAGGNTIVVWTDGRSGNWDVYAQWFGVSGNKLWAADVRVNSESGTAGQGSATVAAEPSGGNAIVVWEDWRNDDHDIYAQRLHVIGNKRWAADVRVNSDSGTEYQRSPAVAVEPTSGNATVVWEDHRNSNGNICAQRLDTSGNKLWVADMRINSDSGTAGQESPAVAAELSGGDAIVVWRDSRNGNDDIYAQRLDVSGNKLWAADVRVNSDSGTEYQRSPVVALEPSTGNTVVMWQDYRNGNGDIYAQRLDAGGNKLWVADVRVHSDSGTAEQIYPVVAVEPSGGNAIVMWQDYRNGNDDIYAQRLDASGNKLWAADVRVNSDSSTAEQASPAVVVEPTSGNAVVVWTDWRNGNYDIYAQRLDASGNKLWATDVCANSDSGTANQWEPTMAVELPSGNAIVVWMDTRNGDWDIYAQRLGASGNRLWPADVRVNADSGAAAGNSPAVAVEPSTGNAIVVWMDWPGGNYDIYAQRLDASGNKLWATDVRVNSDSGTADQFTPAVAVESVSGNAIVAWQDSRNGNTDIYTQRINTVGGKGWPADLQVVYPDIFYFPSGIAQSRSVDTVTGDIRQATLTANYKANGGSVQFYLTNNGGANWFTATLGVATVFVTTGSDLRWRAMLTGDPVWRLRTPVVTSLRIEYSTLAPYADDYEPDDTCAGARPIAVNGASQAHTFHQNADADWTWFDVISGTTYIIQTSDPQTNADTTLELRRTCLQPPLTWDDNTFGREARITWRASFSGAVYVKVANHTPSVFGADTVYDLSVRTFIQPPVGVIVGGHDNGYTLQLNIDHAADMAYRTFLNSGVPKFNIRYLSSNPNRDVDGNGLNDDIYATATITNVRDAIQDWSRARGVALGVPFYVVMVDHGYYDQFLADGTSGKVLAEQLNLWLSNLEATSGADNVNVIIEACHSGSFIDVTTLGPARISGRNRVVIASTSSALNAYPSAQGAYFSDTFWTAVGQNRDLKTSFEWAKQAIQATGLSQEPWLDDNGDAVADGQDGKLARGRGLGAAFAGSPPVIDWVRVGPVSDEQATIQAQVRDDSNVGSVRLVVYPPNFAEPAPTQDGTTPVLNVPTRALTLESGDLFSASYNGFTQTGQYRLVVHAQDADGNQALPMTTFVGRVVYLPVILR